MACSEDRLLDCEQCLFCSKIRAERSANSEREQARFETARSLTDCVNESFIVFVTVTIVSMLLLFLSFVEKAYRVSVNNSRYIRDFVKNGRKTMLQCI